MRSTSLLVASAAALACAAGPRPSPAPTPAAIPAVVAPRPPAAPAAIRVSRGMDAAQVRGALGEPVRKEKVASVAAAGASYERWIYSDREVVLLEGKVVDTLP